MCPGHDESAGKRRSGKTRTANRYLRAALACVTTLNFFTFIAQALLVLFASGTGVRFLGARPQVARLTGQKIVNARPTIESSSIVAASLSRSKGYGEKPGLGTGLLLSVAAPIIWLFVPPKDENAEWHTRKPWQ